MIIEFTSGTPSRLSQNTISCLLQHIQQLHACRVWRRAVGQSEEGGHGQCRRSPQVQQNLNTVWASTNKGITNYVAIHDTMPQSRFPSCWRRSQLPENNEHRKWSTHDTMSWDCPIPWHSTVNWKTGFGPFNSLSHLRKGNFLYLSKGLILLWKNLILRSSELYECHYLLTANQRKEISDTGMESRTVWLPNVQDTLSFFIRCRKYLKKNVHSQPLRAAWLFWEPTIYFGRCTRQNTWGLASAAAPIDEWPAKSETIYAVEEVGECRTASYSGISLSTDSYPLQPVSKPG